MKKAFLSLVALVAMSTSLVSCNGSVSVGYQPGWHYNCYAVYDYWGYYLYDECYDEYYNADGSMTQELDLTAEVADREAFVLDKTASVYAEKFSLSNDQAMKIAKNVKDFAALSERTESDISEFAQKLYGINPSQVVSAVASAQVGMNAELDAVIEEAAANFNTSSENMKAIVKELHGRALEESGISL